jgi:integrase
MSDSDSTTADPSGKPASTEVTTTTKPAKPSDDFPLTPHPAGYWCKKIRGKLHYFGKRFDFSDPAAAAAAAEDALTDYHSQADALHSGRKPRPDSEALTVKRLVNEFLNEKLARVESGELSQRTLDGYNEATDEILAAFGGTRLVVDLNADDFADLRKRLAAKWGPVRLGNTVQYVRSVFKYALEADLIDRPVRFGPTFKKPSKKTLRLHRAQQGLKLFTPDEIRLLLAGAKTQLQAMILLGINAGFGNTDCATLPLAALDLDAGWIDFPRPKTGIHRRCPLWLETVSAIRAVLAERKEPKAEKDAGLLFITKYAAGWTDDSTITHETRKLLNKLDINGHRNFYTLRHTFRTVADEARDQPAADFIMGHARDDMASVYRERISDERLKAVTDHVRAWLFPPKQETKKSRKSSRKAKRA